MLNNFSASRERVSGFSSFALSKISCSEFIKTWHHQAVRFPRIKLCFQHFFCCARGQCENGLSLGLRGQDFLSAAICKKICSWLESGVPIWCSQFPADFWQCSNWSRDNHEEIQTD